MIQTSCFYANLWTYWRQFPHQLWICSSWEPSQSHELWLGGYEMGFWILTEKRQMWNLSLTAARSSRGETLGSFQPALYGLQGQLCEYLGCQRILSFFREIFIFCHEFTLILKSKWRDLNSRLGGCGIYVSEIYFSNFLKNKKKRLKWSSTWFYDST